MPRRSSDPSVHREPHLRGEGYRADPSEAKTDAREARRRPPSEAEAVDQSVYDEPAFSAELAGPAAKGGLTYRGWLEQGRERVSVEGSWGLTLLLALAAGPWAVLGAMLSEWQSWLGALVLVAFAPVAEEMMKVAAALYVVEKRPFLFRSAAQIMLTVLAGALVFSVVENLLYLHVYVRHPSAALIAWRWTVCVALHTGCTFIAGLGLVRIWRDAWERMDRPRLPLGSPYLMTAIVLHAVYNASALLLESTILRT